MKKAVKMLMGINLISYVNNFLFSYAYSNKIINSTMIALGVWALTPYLLATISSFILATDNKEGFKIFKKEAIADWIIRIISYFVVFQQFNFGFMSREYTIQQVVVALLFVMNLILEFKMYNKAAAYIYDKKKNEDEEKVSEDEKQNIKNMGKATTMGVTSMIVVTCVSMSVSQTTHVGGSQGSRLIAFVTAIGCFIWFLKASYEKCQLFYLNKELAKRISIRDGFYATTGFIFCLLSALDVFGAENFIYSLSVFVGILSLYPTIQTSRKMGLRYKKIREVLGDNFYLYFNCKDGNK